MHPHLQLKREAEAAPSDLSCVGNPNGGGGLLPRSDSLCDVLLRLLGFQHLASFFAKLAQPHVDLALDAG